MASSSNHIPETKLVKSSSTLACLTIQTPSNRQVLGILKVKLPYATFFLYHTPEALLESLLNGLHH
ncbi:MAG: hypothetical protein M2R45_02273 [Verrucomicrobia subdivision 3 bacterium]|nr:hypothetical protein [Limisphaerales bacterium]MCS1413941.1 hypothetical protein [Limisphaerales bacterium]